MKIDIVSVFPEFFNVLDLSLMGRARQAGLVSITTHDLRNWTHDVHHSVDDTPVGGGAGMVMKPDVWGDCLDELLHHANGRTGEKDLQGRELTVTTKTSATARDADSSASNTGKGTVATPVESADETVAASPTGPILIFPTPSAPLFTQRDAAELSHAGHLVFGCGRYEGYDARIPAYYAANGVDVREYSIGDYVLNGGEVAVSAMLEAITRLLPGFMGNPDSIVDESYTGGDALLEYRQYTKPAVWRGLAVPEILLGGDHGKVDRFRRDEALTRTDVIRPDLIGRLDCGHLDKADRTTLTRLGWDLSAPHPTR